MPESTVVEYRSDTGKVAKRGFTVVGILLVIATIAVVIAVATSGGDDGPADAPLSAWDTVVERARNTKVRFHHWGGSERLNDFVTETYADVLRDDFGIELVQVLLNDTHEAVDRMAAEEADPSVGAHEGTVDLVWINGENFRRANDEGLLYGPWAEELPNSALVDWDNSAVAYDFGHPVNGMESPWARAHFQFLTDTAVTPLADVPRSFAEFETFCAAHPGKVTYPAPGPGAFQGTRFVKQVLFELTSHDEWEGEFDQALWDEKSPTLWSKLNALKSCLWEGGEQYPKSVPELDEMLANGTVLLGITQSVTGATAGIRDGALPATTRAFVWRTNMIADYSYVAIARNAENVDAAKVLANLILRPDRQAKQIVPANGFGLGFGIDPTRVPEEDRVQLDLSIELLGEGAVDQAELEESMVGEIVSQYQDLIEAGWVEHVLGQK
jgi:putative spermidine/putrescine transport system substrate-binding protein